MTAFKDTELILNPEGKVYHLNVAGEDIADDVIVVGDPDRVAQISARFDAIDFKTQHRELITHTGRLNGKRLTVMSTGMGVGCIDIVATELDAAVNIDLAAREPRSEHRTLNIVRLGTCGALQEDVAVDSLVASSSAIGMDGLLNFYDNFHAVNDDRLSQAFIDQMDWPENMPYPYVVGGSKELLQKFEGAATFGITATAVGFFGPQGRSLRAKPAIADLNERLTAFRYGGQRIVNFEMETSALYGMAAMLGHSHLTVCTIIANRLTRQFTPNLQKSIDHMIDVSLERLVC